jgi:hypothetical protein
MIHDSVSSNFALARNIFQLVAGLAHNTPVAATALIANDATPTKRSPVLFIAIGRRPAVSPSRRSR